MKCFIYYINFNAIDDSSSPENFGIFKYVFFSAVESQNCQIHGADIAFFLCFENSVKYLCSGLLAIYCHQVKLFDILRAVKISIMVFCIMTPRHLVSDLLPFAS
jgi:hypothetical protein